MAKIGIIVAGIILLAVAITGFNFPVNDLGQTTPKLSDMCSAKEDFSQDCKEIQYVTYGIYGMGLFGIILLIIAVIARK